MLMVLKKFIKKIEIFHFTHNTKISNIDIWY